MNDDDDVLIEAFADAVEANMEANCFMCGSSAEQKPTETVANEKKAREALRQRLADLRAENTQMRDALERAAKRLHWNAGECELAAVPLRDPWSDR